MREEWVKGFQPSTAEDSDQADEREPRREMRAELGFGLALATFLGGLWYLGFDVIERITLQSPGERMLLFFGYSHGVVFALFVYSLVLLFDMGLSLVGDGRLPAMAYRVFFYLWPFGLAFILVSFVLHQSQLADPVTTLNVVMAGVMIAAIAVATWGMLKRIDTVIWTSQTAIVILVFAWFYLIIVSVILPDVHIETDKRLYKAHEAVVVSVRTNGYVFNPRITRIEVSGHKVMEPAGGFGNGVTFGCSFDDSQSHDPYVIVGYKPQMSFWAREKYYRLNLATVSPIPYRARSAETEFSP